MVFDHEVSGLCALGAHGPSLGRQEERLVQIQAQRTELQQAADAAGAVQVVQDLIALLHRSLVWAIILTSNVQRASSKAHSECNVVPLLVFS